MRHFPCLVLVGVLLTVLSCSAPAQPPEPAVAAGFDSLVFSDDFTNLDTIDLSGTGAEGFSWYTDRPFGWGRTFPESLSVSDGVLTINQTTPSPNYGIGTTSPTSTHGRGFQYGYFEARIAFDPAHALEHEGFPAFWGVSRAQTIGANFDRSMELDYWEAFRWPGEPFEDVYAGTVHDWTHGPPSIDRANYGNNFRTLHRVDWTEFHTYGCLWQPGYIAWFFNDHLLIEQQYSATEEPDPNPSDLPPRTYSMLDSDRSGQTVILGSGVGFPMHVDWVRVWQ